MMSKNTLSYWRVGVGALLVMCLSITLVPSLMAQTASTGALTGTVRDPSGAVIPNATVTATSLDTGQARTAMTGTDGAYRVALLPPGNYRIRIEAGGFKPVEVPSATVNVTETEVLDRNLEVGSQTQTVTVESEVETIQTTSSTLGTVANARTLTELPLNTRNYTNLLAMSGGVSADVNNATLLGKGTTRMAVNGGTTGQNAYLMDGVPVNNWAGFGGTTEGGTIGSFAMPNPDAIAEFKIQTSSYDAGYGRNPGANVNVVTKSGTNSFHGSVFEFFRNTVLNANDWFLNREGVAKPALNSNQYGGALGGPIKKDKLFFFISYQESDQKNGFSAFSDSATILPPIPGSNRGTCNGGKPGWYSICGVRRGRPSLHSESGGEPVIIQTQTGNGGDPESLGVPCRWLRSGWLIQHEPHRHQSAPSSVAQRQLLHSRFGHLRLRAPELCGSRHLQGSPGHR